MCRLVSNAGNQGTCTKEHVTHFFNCNVGVVYKISLPCRKCCIGQKGRFLNERLREHRNAVNTLAGTAHLADHCRRCARKCYLCFQNKQVLRRFGRQLDKEIFGVWHFKG